MKPRTCLQCSLLVLTLGMATLPALASDDCDVPIKHWQSREAVMQMAASQGWDVTRLKIDDGCYELRGTDADGRSFKAKIDPATLLPVEMKWRDKDQDEDRDRDHDRKRKQEHEDRRQPDSAGSAPSAAGSPFAPGTTPRGQIE